MRIENLWKRGFTWALIVLSVPVALLLLWWPLKYPDATPDPVRERVLAQARAEQVQRVDATLGGTTNRRWLLGSFLRQTGVGVIASSADPAVAAIRDNYRGLDDLAGMPMSRLVRAMRAWEPADFGNLYGLDTAAHALALRAASAGDWDSAIGYERVALAASTVAGEMLGTAWGSHAEDLMRFRPDGAHSQTLAEMLAQHALDAPWHPRSLDEVVTRTVLGERRAEMWGHGDWPLPVLKVAGVAPAALVGMASLSPGFESTRARAAANRLLSSVGENRLEDAPAIGTAKPHYGYAGVLPFTRGAALRSRVRWLAETEPALAADLRSASAALAGTDTVDACYYLFSSVRWITASLTDPVSRQRNSRARMALTAIRLGQAGYAARAFHADTGAWPESVERLGPRYFAMGTGRPAAPGTGALTRALAAVVEPYQPFRLGEVSLTPERFCAIIGVPGAMESGPGKPVQCQITPTADGKCSVSLVITHPGSSVDACLLVYLSEALPHLPIGEDSTATLWSVFPTAPSIFPFPGLVSVGTQAPLHRTPADPVAVKELMSQWLASHQANAPVRAVSDLLERRLGNLQLEYHAVMPRTVFAIWVDVTERDPFVYQPDAPTSHTMAVYP